MHFHVSVLKWKQIASYLKPKRLHCDLVIWDLFTWFHDSYLPFAEQVFFIVYCVLWLLKSRFNWFTNESTIVSSSKYNSQTHANSYCSVSSLCNHTHTHSKLYLFCSPLLPWENIILSEYLFYSLHSLTRRYISILSFLWRLILMVIWLPESTATELVFLSFLFHKKCGKKSFLGLKKEKKRKEKRKTLRGFLLSCLHYPVWPLFICKWAWAWLFPHILISCMVVQGMGRWAADWRKAGLRRRWEKRETNDGQGKRVEDRGCLLLQGVKLKTRGGKLNVKLEQWRRETREDKMKLLLYNATRSDGRADGRWAADTFQYKTLTAY